MVRLEIAERSWAKGLLAAPVVLGGNVGNADAHAFGESGDCFPTRVAGSPFDVREIGDVHANGIGHLFLRLADFGADGSDGLAKGDLEAQRWIDETEYASFERGLLRLGELLGFDAVRPGAKASPDSAWRDGDDHLLWEAKSEQLAGGAVSAKIVRQATTHPTWVVRELDWQSDGNATTYLVTPRAEVEPEAVAVVGEHVQLCALDAVRALTRDAVNLWRDIVGRVQGLEPAEVAELIGRELLQRGLGTADLSSRLGAQPVAEMTAARAAGPAQP